MDVPEASHEKNNDFIQEIMDSSGSHEDECDQYETEQPTSDSKADPLSFWAMKSAIYPRLSQLAKKILCIPSSSTPSERVFSTAGNVISKKRVSLTGEHVNMQIFCMKIGTFQTNKCFIPYIFF